MAFTKTRTFTCDVTDRNGNTRPVTGSVTSGGTEPEAVVYGQVKASAEEQGYTATNITFTSTR